MTRTRISSSFPTLPPSLASLLIVIIAVAGMLAVPERASAQTLEKLGELTFFSAYAGFTSGGDTTVKGTTYGLSTAYVAESGWGAEFDLSHSTKFNDSYEATGLTTAMANLFVSPKVSRWVRPYGAVGVGAIRARGCSLNCVTEFSRTDLGLDAGGGVLVPVKDFFGARFDVRYFRYAQIHQDLPRQDNGAFDFWRVAFGGYVSW